MINVGIDVHKKRCQACLKDEKGRLVEELSIPNTTEGAEQLARMLTTYGEAKIVLESTGNLRIRLYDTLNQHAPTFKVVLANPNKTRIIAEAKIKNDRMDARVLADLVRADSTRWVPSQDSHPQRNSSPMQDSRLASDNPPTTQSMAESPVTETSTSAGSSSKLHRTRHASTRN
jgi:transposase